MLPVKRLNLRDIGGHPISGGGEVAMGLVFRSSAVAVEDTNTAAHLVRTHGICRIVDLRMRSEVGEWRLGDLGCERMHVPLFDHIRTDWDQPPFDDPETTARRYVEMLEDGGEALGRILTLASESGSSPTLIHCHAGRDRTGIVIACILELVGVPDEMVAADYSQSDRVLDGRRAHAVTVLEFFRLARARYGSIRQMALMLGCQESTLMHLRHTLLAPPAVA